LQGTAVGAPSTTYVSFTDSAGTRLGYVGDGSSGDKGIALDSDAGDIALVTMAGRVVNVTAAGNVGVNTPTPAEALDVHGNLSLFGGNRSVVLVTASAGGAVPCTNVCSGIAGACMVAFPDVAGSGPTSCSDNTQNHVCLCATHPR
jgi:hypothetical protein